MKPKEGTILTVAKEAALKAAEIAPEAEELQPFFEEVFAHAEATLARTPEMLPVLKEAGVVDSGGQGLLEVLRGAMDGFLGKEIDYSVFEKSSAPSVTKFLLRLRQILNSATVQSLSFFWTRLFQRKRNINLKNSLLLLAIPLFWLQTMRSLKCMCIPIIRDRLLNVL